MGRSAEVDHGDRHAEAISEALASARLDGLEPSPDVLADAELVTAGKMTIDELVDRTLTRYRPHR